MAMNLRPGAKIAGASCQPIPIISVAAKVCLNIDVGREATAVIEPTVRFPVACPKCGTERLTEIPADVVANSLRRGSDICLVATCHDVIRIATELELEQIHQYLRAVHPAMQCLPKETDGAAFGPHDFNDR
jgi:hypothetical protein